MGLGIGCLCVAQRWLAFLPTVVRALQLVALSRRPVPKFRVSPVTVSVRSACGH
jgi:hypothetical protein